MPACAPTAPPSRVDTVASGLEVPWDVAFLPGGAALVTERPGRIRRIDPVDGLNPTPWAELDVHAPDGSEIGLMGIDLAPDGRSVYVVTTRADASSGPGRISAALRRRLRGALDPEASASIWLTVWRIPLEGSEAGPPTTVVDGIPSGYLHGGGALRFGPDGSLYVTNGDGGEPWWAQQPDVRRGKLLAYTPGGRGSAPSSWTSSVHASGIRHSQGLAWHPVTGELLLIDHGPSGLEWEDFRTDNDELSSVEPGANLGWPIVAGATSGTSLTSPLVEWTPAIAPGGLEVYGGAHPTWFGNAFVTSLRGTSLRRISMDSIVAGRVRPRCEEVLLPYEAGRLRLVREAPDGTLWVGTSNRDGRGIPRLGDDVILRLTPPDPARPDRDAG